MQKRVAHDLVTTHHQVDLLTADQISYISCDQCTRHSTSSLLHKITWCYTLIDINTHIACSQLRAASPHSDCESESDCETDVSNMNPQNFCRTVNIVMSEVIAIAKMRFHTQICNCNCDETSQSLLQSLYVNEPLQDGHAYFCWRCLCLLMFSKHVQTCIQLQRWTYNSQIGAQLAANV